MSPISPCLVLCCQHGVSIGESTCQAKFWNAPNTAGGTGVIEVSQMSRCTYLEERRGDEEREERCAVLWCDAVLVAGLFYAFVLLCFAVSAIVYVCLYCCMSNAMKVNEYTKR